jgi:alpha-D-ribose 1-methylphosphonate 5-triphosphate synthase subunit PhnG
MASQTPKVECPECGKNVAHGKKVGQGNRFDRTHGLRTYAVVKLKKHAGCDQATAIKF